MHLYTSVPNNTMKTNKVTYIKENMHTNDSLEVMGLIS